MSETTIGFYNPASVHPYATQAALSSVRLIYPAAPVVISCDAAHDFSQIARQYHAEYVHYYHKISYPQGDLGYSKINMLTWLDRLYLATTRLKTDYVVLWEDDCILMKPITIDTDWYMAGHKFLFPGQVPTMPESFLDLIQQFSGVRPSTNVYNCGGGSIFHSQTLIDNYNIIRQFWHENFDNVQQNIYRTIGWPDCFMTVFYYMSGKKLNENKRLYNNYPLVKPFNFSVLAPDIEIVHYVKDLY
jgi:hypothetical protein